MVREQELVVSTKNTTTLEVDTQNNGNDQDEDEYDLKKVLKSKIKLGDQEESK